MAYTAWSVVFGEQPTAAKWNQLGANDAGFKDGTNIDAGAIITAKLADNGVTAAKIATGAVLLGYNIASADQSGINTVETDLTFANVTVTVPTGGRNVLLEMIIPTGNTSGGTADQVRFYFKEGSTYFNTANFTAGNTFGATQHYSCLIPSVAAGSHTYKVAAKRVNGSGNFAINYSATSPDIGKPQFLVWGL